jgi:hypothetical protein
VVVQGNECNMLGDQYAFVIFPSVIILYITRKWVNDTNKRLHSLAQIVLANEQQIARNLKLLLLHDDMQD